MKNKKGFLRVVKFKKSKGEIKWKKKKKNLQSQKN